VIERSHVHRLLESKEVRETPMLEGPGTRQKSLGNALMGWDPDWLGKRRYRKREFVL
jgi:hypothetical protein